MAAIRFENVTKKYGDTPAVNNLNLEIPDKEFLVLVGPSGCGKSTTLRMLAGLEDITSGNIYIGDRLVNNVPSKDRDIAMVFQSYALYPHMTVYDNMAFGLSIQKVPRDEIKRRVSEAGRILGIEDLLKRKPRQLSGGQRQRVALGRAIVREPAAFLLDEPLSNLDAKLRVTTRAELKKLHQRLQTTFVYVTHDQTEATTMASRIAVLDKGILQQVGTPQKLYDEPDNVFVAGFIGSPSMNFFDLNVEGDETGLNLTSESLHLAVPPQKADRLMPYIGKTITFGIRPEDIYIKGHVPEGVPSQAEVNAKVDVIEAMGNELFVYMVSGKHQQFLARVDPRVKAHMGQDITAIFNMGNMYSFEKETGNAIIATKSSIPVKTVV